MIFVKHFISQLCDFNSEIYLWLNPHLDYKTIHEGNIRKQHPSIFLKKFCYLQHQFHKTLHLPFWKKTRDAEFYIFYVMTYMAELGKFEILPQKNAHHSLAVVGIHHSRI